MKYIVANWKAHFTLTSVYEWVHKFSALPLDSFSGTVEFIICPPLPFIQFVNDMLYHPAIKMGAQDLSMFEEGPYTGEVAATMLDGLVDYAIVGHSERRIHFNEDDIMLEKKCEKALESGIEPILCVRGPDDHIPDIVTFIAFEIMEAIGSGNNIPVPEVIAMKKKLGLHEDKKFIYGGSVKATNAAEYLTSPDIDGVILGGASLDPQEIFSIAKIANKSARM